MGVSGRAMMGALIAGERDPEALAELAKGRMRPKMAALAKALTAPASGTTTPTAWLACWSWPTASMPTS
jgi:hypothetical protein